MTAFVAAEAMAAAPGRVNLLGEHTDYNDGYVLPSAIPQTTRVRLRARDGTGFRLESDAFREPVAFDLDARPSAPFARYVYGCLRVVAATGVRIPALDIQVRSDVPIGVGLSSSAALEVATLRALRALLALELDDVALARLAQRAEIEDAGVRCGIMDPMAASLAHAGEMLFLDTRTLARRVLPLPPGAELLVLDSGIARTLAGSSYNARRRECEAAARALGVPALRDVASAEAVEALPEPLRSRARHVVTENGRVLRGIESADARVFGALMNASHASLRDDFEVSTPALDRLVALLQAHDDVFGARLTGAGFGGACVALCRAGTALAVADVVLGEYGAAGGRGARLVPPSALP
jgi:galactokinase